MENHEGWTCGKTSFTRRPLLYAALEGQIEEYEGEIVRLQRSTSQLDEDTKLYHRQFIQNRDSIEK